MLTATQLTVGYLTLDQLDEVLAIERQSFPLPWSRHDFTKLRLTESFFALTARSRRGQAVRGYAVYRLCPYSVRLYNLAVAPRWRRTGVASQLVEHLAEKLGREDLLGRVRTRILVDVSERNLEAQLFFRAFGFRCVNCCRGAFDGDDGMRFVLYKD